MYSTSSSSFQTGDVFWRMKTVQTWLQMPKHYQEIFYSIISRTRVIMASNQWETLQCNIQWQNLRLINSVKYSRFQSIETCRRQNILLQFNRLFRLFSVVENSEKNAQKKKRFFSFSTKILESIVFLSKWNKFYILKKIE